MRRILIDHARARKARGGSTVRLEDLNNVGALVSANPQQILAVDAALARLEDGDPDAAAVVRLRFFAGLSVDQAAGALRISPRSAAVCGPTPARFCIANSHSNAEDMPWSTSENKPPNVCSWRSRN